MGAIQRPTPALSRKRTREQVQITERQTTSDFLIRREFGLAHFSMKNENSPCEDWRFIQNKVPNQVPEIVMKYAYGSGNLNLFAWLDSQIVPSQFPCGSGNLTLTEV